MPREIAPNSSKTEAPAVDWHADVRTAEPTVSGNILTGELPGQKGQPERTGMGVSWTTSERGLTLAQVFPNSPAQRVGLLPNDTITAINGRPSRSLSDADLTKMVTVEGARVKLDVQRENNKLSFDMTIGKYKACNASPEYQRFVDVTAKNFFAPKDLGNITELYHRHDCEIGSSADAALYAKQAIAVIGDPYTFVMDRKALKSEERSLENHMVGVGVQFERDSLTIKSVIPGAPADRAGVQAGDVVVAVDHEPVKGLSAAAAIEKIGGDIGKPVALTLEREGKNVDAVIVRNAFKYPTIERDAGGGVEYIRSTSFMPRDAAQEMRRAIERHPQAKAFVIDMRQNGGGLVENAISMAELFVAKGAIVTIKHREPSNPQSPTYESTRVEVGDWFTTRATSGDKLLNYGYRLWPREPNVIGNRPVVILVDGNTASAAEMFTAAVRDNKAATVVGEKTFGKGIGQNTFIGLPESSGVHVTTLRYYTPAGTWLGDANKNRIGITPDVIVKNKPYAQFLSKDDIQYQTALSIAKSKIR